VVERILGKAEVLGSIPSGGAIFEVQVNATKSDITPWGIV
jgi:hypothetical protein